MYKIIAEIKKASPSKGLIREKFDVKRIAQEYTKGGATCLSVLTDGPSFCGKQEYVSLARKASNLPILRKDFMFDPYQVFEARVIGADCILIIMAAVSDDQANELESVASDLSLDVLIEIHNESELERALKLKSSILGINNRNLNTFEVDLTTTEKLARLVPAGKIIISESGITNSTDLERMTGCGAEGFLIGETLMRQNNIEKATKILALKNNVS
jgi:indole-3-glycerol phosphate synthase